MNIDLFENYRLETYVNNNIVYIIGLCDEERKIAFYIKSTKLDKPKFRFTMSWYMFEEVNKNDRGYLYYLDKVFKRYNLNFILDYKIRPEESIIDFSRKINYKFI